MEREDKEKYAVCLLKRLEDMFTENKVEKYRYKQLKYNRQNNSNYQFTESERETWYREGVKHKPSAFKRVRIELNTILKDLEKDVYGNN